ncbi:MAG: ATP-grasp domain-containing protein, partial [Bacteroidales bacterium]|nr:ATP-grasp domain-containing protein [Bacteroidales bacterium]
MSERVNVLMLGGAKRVSLARLLKSAGSRMGIDVGIVSYEIMPTVPIASEGEVVVGRRWRDEGIYESLAEVIAERHIDIVLPFVDGAIEICSELRQRHPDVFVPVSEFEVAHKMFDKSEAARVFASHGFDIPATYDADNCRFPAILKPREGSASRGIVVARTAKDLAEAGDLSRYLVQEYVENADEYTVDCYVSTISGRVVCAVPRLRISTSGGEVDRTET